ncbi:Rv3235 family protein [Arthrobacter sp. NA-172]|uniref:Rv3235 family protein n=1 Tax=Arthrobacter sp. NA-172 TaxID=3367524 RepID=UPI003753EFEE
MSATSATHPPSNTIRTATAPRVVPVLAAPPPRAKARRRSGSGEGPGSAPKVVRMVSGGREIHTLARSIAQAAVEVLAGTRPVHQLSRSLDPRSLNALQHRAALTRAYSARAGRSRLHRSPIVRSVHVCSVSEGVYEASVVVSEELRSRAVAMRLEGSNGVWKVTALEIG